MDKKKLEELLARLPAHAREDARANLEKMMAAQAANKRKQAQADRFRNIRGARFADDESKALAEHDQQRMQAAAAQARKPTGTSRRRRKADAFRERGAALRQRTDKHREQYQQTLKGLGQHDACPEVVEPGAFRAGQLVLADRDTGHCARIAIAQMPRALAQRVKRAALSPEPYAGKRKRRDRVPHEPTKKKLDGGRAAKRYWREPGKRHWFHPAALQTVAFAAAMWRQARDTKRDGFARVTRGLSRSYVCQMIADPRTGAPPSENALFGTWNDIPGIVRALEQAGVLHVHQPLGYPVGPRDRGPSGFPFNVYWFYALPDFWPAPEDDDDAELDELARVGACIDEDSRAGPRAPPA